MSIVEKPADKAGGHHATLLELASLFFRLGTIAFGIGSSLAGGKSIIVVPSSSIVKGQRISRIVPSIAPSSVFTLPRAFVHYVVTEHGVATLKGKSIRERARELIAVSHPDFRAELTAEAKRLYG